MEVGERGEVARGEERVAKVADHPLHPALLVAASHGARLRGEVIVAGELEHARMKPNVVPDALKNDAFQIVVQQGPGHAAQGAERLNVPTEKTLQCLVQGEARVDSP